MYKIWLYSSRTNREYWSSGSRLLFLYLKLFCDTFKPETKTFNGFVVILPKKTHHVAFFPGHEFIFFIGWLNADENKIYFKLFGISFIEWNFFDVI